MKRNTFILLIVASILIVFSTLIFASETIDVKDYIKGNFPLIFNIYLAPLGELDEYEKEFIDLLQNLSEEEQKNFAKEVYNNGFTEELLEEIKAKPEPIPKIIEERKEPKNTGKWLYKKGIDQIDDSTVISFVLVSDSGQSVLGKSVSLIVRYRSGKNKEKTELYINWHDYFSGQYINGGYDNTTPVTYRLGIKKAKTSCWAIGTDHTATFYVKPWSLLNIPSSKNTIKFIRKLFDVDRFVVRATPYNESPITAVFDVRGLRDAVEQFDELNWMKD